MTKGTRRALFQAGCFAGLSVLACGNANSSGDVGDDSDGTRGGQVTEAWQDYCTAKFSADYPVKDLFDQNLFTARAGESYLMSAYGAAATTDRATLLYLDAAGPKEFVIDAPSGSRAFPFTTGCGFDVAPEYLAVFRTTSVFTEEGLTTKLCELESNLVTARDPARSSGFLATSLNLSGPTTYQVQLNAFSERCGNVESGYISVPQTQIFGSTTWLVPLAIVLGLK